ncbi:hypothetical protein HBI24_085060 [Parastagonospora nodorum]|nr:hypothetical protein HBH53_195080 [Parastagonospora nodorum]KAH5509002.1 hypothetical protein HBI52_136590 [Parastagonospora nodorum]KAH5585919.1 hypothetical protein HBI24_085060 [Parastagonospora nodorum]KAH5764896.1 hypothetical protein HBI97_180010 [Parastagonospora nodorum]KAH5796783.1 hypothetical protein HBI96_172490 [Parastagonospora nodorum]
MSTASACKNKKVVDMVEEPRSFYACCGPAWSQGKSSSTTSVCAITTAHPGVRLLIRNIRAGI